MLMTVIKLIAPRTDECPNICAMFFFFFFCDSGFCDSDIVLHMSVGILKTSDTLFFYICVFIYVRAYMFLTST